jgi:hypothetical protein
VRTDANNNPTAFTTDLARQAGLGLGTDYEPGSPFPTGDLITARILGDPVGVTIRLIDAVGFFTSHGAQRWTYIGLPRFVWKWLSLDQKRDVIGFMYQHEGGTTMRHLFPNYGKP